MQKFNYHTHTYRCGHADMSISDEEYVKMFVDKGFNRIAFTDHCPFKEKIDFRNNMRMGYDKKEDYYKSIKSLKEKYKNIINIEVGFEVEYAPGLEGYLRELKQETDKLILGQHFIFDGDGNIKIVGWGITNDEDVIRYGEYIEKAMSLNIPNVIAHPDLFMLEKSKFNEACEKATHIICKAAEKYKIPLEINLTRAAMCLNGQINRIEYPNKDFWDIASRYDIKVVYGVDAHFRSQIELYEESIKKIEQHLGLDIINRLNFCDENL
jgi:histidinol-phosphatase (PHP family)